VTISRFTPSPFDPPNEADLRRCSVFSVEAVCPETTRLKPSRTLKLRYHRNWCTTLSYGVQPHDP
jgi:hypothetical protein